MTPYASVGELKLRTKSKRDLDNAPMRSALEAASQAIDSYCGRTFTKGESEPRFFQARARGRLVQINDTPEIEEVAYSTTGQNGTFQTYASTDLIEVQYVGRPIHALKPDTARGFPVGERCWIRVTPTEYWGWEEVPAAVHEACLLQAHKLFRRESSPEGLMGFESGGGGRVDRNGLDGDAKTLLKSFVVVQKFLPGRS